MISTARSFKGSGAAFGCLIALVCASLTTVAGAATSPSRVSLANSVEPFAIPAHLARSVGPTSRVRFDLYLGLRDPAGAEATLRALSSPGSPTYRRFLTPGEFRSRFARPDSDVAAVTSWLRGSGFTVGDIPLDHTTVQASGTATQVDAAFGVRLGRYRTGHGIARAADRAPSIPASLGSIVRGVIGLTPTRMRHGSVAPPPAYRDAQPCAAYWGAKIATSQPRYGRVLPWAPCGYSPKQLQDAYGLQDAIAGGNDGSGVTVAVIDAFASPTMQSDLDRYSARHGLPQTTIEQFRKPACPKACPPRMQSGWWYEEVIDLDAVHTMAPGAHLVFWGAASPWDIDLRPAMADIVDHHRADVISDSFGDFGEQLRPSDVNAWYDLFIQAGDEGIGITFPSGDDGDDAAIVGYRTTEYPESDPLVTSVGGTSLAVGALRSYLFQTVWGTDLAERSGKGWARPSFWAGGGGGTSRIFPEPWYQQGVVPPKLAGVNGGHDRVVPDIAMDADPYTGGLLTGETLTFPGGHVRYDEFEEGGTSLASPLFAGVMADADQAAGSPLGFLNPFLYSLSGTSALHDIVTPSHRIAEAAAVFNNGVDASDGRDFQLSVLNHDTSLHTQRGYDDATGLGSPRGQAFLDALP